MGCVLGCICVCEDVVLVPGRMEGQSQTLSCFWGMLINPFLPVLRLIQTDRNLIIKQGSGWLILVQDHQRQHSQACNKIGGHSITILPLVEQAG